MSLTPSGLEDSLVNFIKNEVATKITLKSYDKQVKKTIYKTPQVVKGYILPKFKSELYDESSEFPYIVVRLMKLSDLDDQHIITVKILFGVYCIGSYKDDNFITDGSGYRDIWNLIEKTRQALFKARIIDNRYRLIDKIEAEFPDDQPYPQWEGWLIINFDIGRPEKE